MIQATHSKISKTITQPAVFNEKVVQAAWVVAQSALWPAIQLSQKETKAARGEIRQALQAPVDTQATSGPATNGNMVKAFAIFCQRVLLARQYVQQDKRRYVPLPAKWLQATNAKGYAGTWHWYQQVEEIRASLPQYRIAMKAFAEAVLDLAIEPTSDNFQYWKQYFIEKEGGVLLPLFLMTIANLTYQTK